MGCGCVETPAAHLNVCWAGVGQARLRAPGGNGRDVRRLEGVFSVARRARSLEQGEALLHARLDVGGQLLPGRADLAVFSLCGAACVRGLYWLRGLQATPRLQIVE